MTRDVWAGVIAMLTARRLAVITPMGTIFRLGVEWSAMVVRRCSIDVFAIVASNRSWHSIASNLQLDISEWGIPHEDCDHHACSTEERTQKNRIDRDFDLSGE
jgi:hypothetical protein